MTEKEPKSLESQMNISSVNGAAGKVEGDQIINIYGNIPPQSKSQEPGRLAFAIAGTLDNIDRAKLNAIAALLKKISGDASIEIIDLDEGSIKIILEGSEEGLSKIQELFESGELNEVEGFPVEYVRSLTEAENEKVEAKSHLVQQILAQTAKKQQLSGAYLIWAYLIWAYLSGAYLSGAYLSGAYLSGAYLSGANLSRANLSRANLSRANLSGANLSRANLKNTQISQETKLNYKWRLIWKIVNQWTKLRDSDLLQTVSSQRLSKKVWLILLCTLGIGLSPIYAPKIIEPVSTFIEVNRTKEKLKEAENHAQIAENLAQNAQNVTTLKEAKTNWQKAIQILEVIPDGNSLALEVQIRLLSYKSNLAKLEKRIITEQKPQEILDEAKAIGEKATQELEQFGKDGTKKISVLNKIKAQFQQALEKLKIITSDHPDSLVVNETQNLIQNYESKIEQINNELVEIRKQCPRGDGIGSSGNCLP
ncbi:MAG: hypothetical protein F6K10_07380 [Moorea sp. SIO2B7]|nr:hypothetical protein [Moorena sp. SIO2B7]